MKKSDLLLFFVFAAFFGSCKNKVSDDLSVFGSAEYESKPPNKKIEFLDSIRVCCLPKVNDSITRNFLFNLSSEYYYLNQHQHAIAINRNALKLAVEAQDTVAMAKANYYIGDSFESTRKDSAYHYYLEAEKLYTGIGEYERAGQMKFNKAYLLFREGNNVESEIELANALGFLINSDDKKLLFAAYNLMGSNFEQLDDYANAMKYYLMAKGVLDELREENFSFDRQFNYTITSSINIANVYEKTGQYAKAIQELNSLITPKLKKEWPSEYAVAVGNLGYSKMRSGDMRGVEELLTEALIVSEKYDPESQLVYKLNNLGEYYLLTGDTAKSAKLLKRSLEISKRTKGGEEIKSTLKLLSRADSANDAIYKESYIRYTDSLSKVQRANRNKFARIEYETSRVEDQNRALTTRSVTIALISVLIIFVLVLLLVFRYIKSQRRELEFKKQQRIADEELHELLKEHQLQVDHARHQEQNRISGELHDGIMNKIYGVRLHLGMLNDCDDSESKVKRLKYVDALQQIEREVRSISHDLHVDLDQGQSNFIALLKNIVEQQNHTGDTQFHFTQDEDIAWDEISGLTKITISRVLQEAVSNARKYSHAAHCFVAIAEEGNEITLSIQDDGKGFDAKTASEGIGLKNMKARAKTVNGKLAIDSTPDKGTKIELHVLKQ